MDHLLLALLIAFASIYFTFRLSRRISISDIQGPKPESFPLGNLYQYVDGQSGEADIKWRDEYGGVVRIKGALGEDRLLISDPKALLYIFQTSAYNFIKPAHRRALSGLLVGYGLAFAEADNHRRQRKVMLPGFGAAESRAFLPIFSQCAGKMTAQWKDAIEATTEDSKTFNIPSWTSRATLDAIGLGIAYPTSSVYIFPHRRQAAFDYSFGAMENASNPYTQAYNDIGVKVLSSPSRTRTFVQGFGVLMPNWLVHVIVKYLPNKGLDRIRGAARVADGIAKTLIDTKNDALLQEKGKHDVMSLLVKANAAEDEKEKMTDDEMIGQMRTILFAGHETTASTLSWALYELARHKDMQARVRDEIRTVGAARGNSEFTWADMEAMPFTISVIKEVLRMYPIVYHSFRESVRDDVLPLAKPIVTRSGRVLNEVPIPKGLSIMTSIYAYNRDKDIFGDDAYVFNPERWMGGMPEKKGPTAGVYSNLLTFAGGVRSCIGYRFAVIELQAFIVELINNFEFSIEKEVEKKIRVDGGGLLAPVLQGEIEKGAQMPLIVSVAP